MLKKRYRFTEFVLIIAEIAVMFLMIAVSAYTLRQMLDNENLEHIVVLQRHFLLSESVSKFSMFFQNLFGESHLYINVFLVFVGLLVFVALIRLLYIIFYINTKENTIYWFFILLMKVFGIFSFLIPGTAEILDRVSPDDPTTVMEMFDFGDINNFKSMLGLFALIFYILALIDVIRYHAHRISQKK